MKIPFGSRAPNEKELDQLKLLGFDLTKIIQQGRYYFLEIPNDPRMQVKETNPAFDRRQIEVKFNGVEVIFINQKTAMYDSWVRCYLNEKNIEQALLQKEFIPEKKQELTEYQKKLNACLRWLETIIFEDGAQKGYGKMIGRHLQELLELKKENLEEHSKFIASNENYTKLYEMFPNWTNINSLQKKYEAMGVEPFMAASANNYDGTSKQCRL